MMECAMTDVKWIKIRTDIFDDEKIRLIDAMPERDGIFVIWIKLLALAGKVNDDGSVYLTEDMPYTEEMLSTLFNRPVQTIRLALKTFDRMDMIQIKENARLIITNWEKHQNVDGLAKIKEVTRKRVAKYRERKKLEQSNVTVTECNATEKIREDKRREDKNKNQELVSLNDNVVIKKAVATNNHHSIDSEANQLAVDALVSKVAADKGVKNQVGVAIYRARNNK